jgi:hypothetical protein
MAGNYLGRAAAYAMHKKYPSGSQTPAQLAAERANLVKARHARNEYKHTKSAKIVDKVHKFNYKSHAYAADAKVFRRDYLKPIKNRAVGIKYIRFSQKARLPKLRVTGRRKRFQRNIGSAKYMARAGWGRAEASKHFKSRLKPRVRHFKKRSHWRHRRKRYTPF